MPLSKPHAGAGSTTTAPGASGFAHSQTEPATRAIGDLWMELNTSDFPKYGWLWRWDGLRWLSSDFELDYSVNNLGGRFDYFIHCNPAFNYLFKAINSNFVLGYASDSTYYWQFDLLTISTSGSANTFFSDNTIGKPANVWSRKNTPINMLIDVAATSTNLFYLLVQPHNYGGNLYAAIQLVYNLARP